MPNCHQESSSSHSLAGRHVIRPTRSCPTASPSGEPHQKRLRSDPHAHAPTQASVTSTTNVSTHQDHVASHLDSWIEEYDAGIDPQEKARRVLEQRRKRRQAILAKFSSSHITSPPGDNIADSAPTSPQATSSAPQSVSLKPNDQATLFLVKSINAAHNDTSSEHASAAELEPDADRQQELARLEQRRHSKDQARFQATEHDHHYEKVEITDDQDDDELDMFALSDHDNANESVANKKTTNFVRILKCVNSTEPPSISATALPLPNLADTSGANISSNWDDSDGYLRTILGETLDERYQIFALLGKGMFASVVRARDLRDNARQVAIKIIRAQESMYKAGLKELSILRDLNHSDPDDRKHLVRLERHFDYKGHLCMVFESLGMNLRELVRRYGRDVGLNLQAVRTYAHQLFLALSHLAKQSVIHADIKPDNVLVNDSKTSLKLCDLGSASLLSEMEITPYLVSRFYRAPEVILGQAYDGSIDVWSVGCTLYELATGKILFPGRTNNHMLLLMQQVRGRFTTKQIRKSQFGEQHFDDANAFLSIEPDKNTGLNVVRKVMLHKPTSDLRSRLLSADTLKLLQPDELKMSHLFVDFLERCLELDPAKRIKPNEALEHAFLAHVSKSA